MGLETHASIEQPTTRGMIADEWIMDLLSWRAPGSTLRPGLSVVDLRVRMGDGDVDPVCTSMSGEDIVTRRQLSRN